MDWCAYLMLVLHMAQCVVQASLLQPLLCRNRAFEERSSDFDLLGWLITAETITAKRMSYSLTGAVCKLVTTVVSPI